MITAALSRPAAPARRSAGDLPPLARATLATGAALLTAATGAALVRAGLGAPHGAALRETALAIHLVSVVPALPLGAYVLVGRKGGARHRVLGKVWLALMLVAAVSALWVRHLNGGRLSYIHLLVPVVLVTSWRVIASARRGDIRRHRRAILGLFIGGLLVPGLLSFIPGRLMLTWLAG